MIRMYVHIYLSRILLVLAGSKDFSSFLIICFKFSASVKRKKQSSSALPVPNNYFLLSCWPYVLLMQPSVQFVCLAVGGLLAYLLPSSHHKFQVLCNSTDTQPTLRHGLSYLVCRTLHFTLCLSRNLMKFNNHQVERGPSGLKLCRVSHSI